MNWNNAVWLYCERGTNASYLAEPVNLASNAAYLLAFFAAIWVYGKLSDRQKSDDHTLLLGLAFLAAIGGFAFHLFAKQWSELADLLPLLIFFTVYMAFALNRFLEIPPGWTTLIVILLVIATLAALTMTCFVFDRSMQPSWSSSGTVSEGATSCLNGAFGYFPFALSLAFMAFLLRARGHLASSSMMLAAGLFFASMIFYAIDNLVCAQLRFAGYAIGTHFIWHALNGLVLFILLRSSMVHQNQLSLQEIIPPDPRQSKKH